MSPESPECRGSGPIQVGILISSSYGYRMYTTCLFYRNTFMIFKMNKYTIIQFKISIAAAPTTTIPVCGTSCSKTIILSSTNTSGVYQWQSPNWGVSDYPEDCVCDLNVEVKHISCNVSCLI